MGSPPTPIHAANASRSSCEGDARAFRQRDKEQPEQHLHHEQDPASLGSDCILEAADIRMVYRRGKTQTEAVKSASFRIDQARTLGVVGESGSGKSTLARIIVGLVEPTSGSLLFKGRNLLSSDVRRETRSEIQMVFQDASSSLNPSLDVFHLLDEGIRRDRSIRRDRRQARAVELLESVRLPSNYLPMRPYELSGGERQRVGIARALSVRPELLVADEPVSALDVSVQAGILNLLVDLKNDLGLAVLFISHDLGVIEYVSDEVLVMRAGEVEEYGPSDLLRNPSTDYTRELLAASQFATWEKA